MLVGGIQVLRVVELLSSLLAVGPAQFLPTGASAFWLLASLEPAKEREC